MEKLEEEIYILCMNNIIIAKINAIFMTFTYNKVLTNVYIY